MQKIKSFTKPSKMDFYSMFVFIDNIKNIGQLRHEIELCIIQTDFSDKEIYAINDFKKQYQSVDFWLCSQDLSKKNISIANKMGIKTVISPPINNETIEEYFISKYGIKPDKDALNDWDYKDIAGLKIMIVDDNKMNIELLEEILSKFNLEISSYLKPKEAQKALSKDKFDLFLLDIMMPEMSGFELAEKIKQIPEYQNIPIIFISALSDSQNKIKSYNLGSFAYIEKPFDVNVLRTQIFNLLKNKKAHELVASNKDCFLATIVHDLKTPISAGINALNLLLNKKLGNLEEPQHEIVEDLLNSTKYMQDMVENILCKNKIENNKITLSKQIHCIKELVKHCINITQYVTTEKNQKIKLKCNVENSLLPLDYVEIKRALHNLIANASAYSPKNSEIVIEIFKKNEKMGISVQDSGHGIEIEDQDEVFYKYMSLAKKHKTVGSGLGLYITKRIIEAHDGDIILESKPGFGTKITILLPIYEKT